MSKKSVVKEDKKIGEEELKIESRLELETITLKRSRWFFKIKVDSILPRAYRSYRMLLAFDEQPDLDRIADLEKDLKGSLFENDRASRRATDKKISEIRERIRKLKSECEDIEFSATIESLKYKDNGTNLEARIPDDIVEPFNRQKSRLDLYKISLIPIL